MSGPAWLDESYLYRWPFLVDLTAGNGASSQRIDDALPSAWDWFYTNITDTTNFYDVVLTHPDGITFFENWVVTIDIAGQTGDIEADTGVAGWSNSAQMGVAWLYFGYDGSAPDESAGVMSADPARDAFFQLTGPAPHETIVSYSTDRTALDVVQKTPGETIRIWFNVTSLLTDRLQLHSGALGGEGVAWIVWTVYDGGTAGAAQAAMISDTAQRYVLRGEEHLIGCLVQAGTDATTYLGVLKVVLTDGRAVLMTVEIQVAEIEESA